MADYLIRGAYSKISAAARITPTTLGKKQNNSPNNSKEKVKIDKLFTSSYGTANPRKVSYQGAGQSGT